MGNHLIFVGAVFIVGGCIWYWREPIKEKLKGWRTMIWNAFLGSGPIALAIADKLQAVDWNSVVTPMNAIIAGIVVMVVGMVLRAITTGPVGSKGEEEPSPETKSGD